MHALLALAVEQALVEVLQELDPWQAQPFAPRAQLHDVQLAIPTSHLWT